ncbi:hypothetical protein K493DRAFT_308859 [Basidiobolus meristosporus CBS 931.73]|uniref:Protein regulator of cytokinesis 1 n=1 Tax=Basidiobolus meristosporus CBS 931.73 TaxID=1314790 RepID=A0A1Y1WWM5_9FUNG|nr:hypothetical protein K493DRAFT_308859 [Basidiobolus meristosporus CBS 931.73]|eukprot:ORX77606.1 hypothetical protein K493DRAFT_308859 [Basidiobolus meristosporus CBS 931.73]
MEIVRYRVQQLYSLWNELGYFESEIKCADKKCTIPSWVERKLQPALHELDRLAASEAKRCAMLKAETEDLEMSIEEKCQLLGRNADLYLPKYTPVSTRSLYTTYLELKSLNNSLDAELSRQKQLHEAAMDTLHALSRELHETQDLPKPKPDDFSRSTVDFLTYAATKITILKETRVQEFDQAATDLYEAWQNIKFAPTDEIEKSLVRQFTLEEEKHFADSQKPHPKKSAWYTPNQPPLELSKECVELMKQKQCRYTRIMEERKQRYATLLKKINRLYIELDIPNSRQKKFQLDYEDTTLAQMEAEHEHLREILLINLDQLFDDYKQKLAEYWEKCEISREEQRFTMLRIMEGINKVERADIIREELIRLEELYSQCHLIFSAMQERRQLIHKMIEFEKTASDPRRLFRSSFQLNQEEKWRKKAYPNLLKFEEQLINAILNYELQENKPFIHNNQRYMDVLDREIAERPVNLTLFGFGSGTYVKDRSASYSGPTSSTSSYGGHHLSPSRTSAASHPVSRFSHCPTRSVSRTSNADDCHSSVSSNDSGDSIRTPLQAPSMEELSPRPSSACYENSASELQTPRVRSKLVRTSMRSQSRYRSSPSPSPITSTPRSAGTAMQKVARKQAVATLFGDIVNSPSPTQRSGALWSKNASQTSKH